LQFLHRKQYPGILEIKPMRKTSLLLTSIFLLSITSHAQFRIAIVGGGHQSSVSETNDLPGWDSLKNNYSGRVGFHFGFIADLPLTTKSNLSFQPGVIYYNKGRKYAQRFNPPVNDVTSFTSTQYVNYIDVPLNLVLKFGKKTKFIIGGGPYGSFLYTGKETSKTTTPTGATQTENEDLPVGKKAGQYRIFNYGVNGLIGFESGRVFLTANYSRGMNDFYKASNYNGTFKHQIIGATLGIYLGKPVTNEKKIKDKDKDAVPDDTDNCPNEAGPSVTNGCPDKDADGIADKDDKCPDTKGTVANKGCPVLDKDSDGVNDDDDKCPDVPGYARYGGCRIPDTDKDGINEEEDKCPDVMGYARYGGCPVPDTDGDSVDDELDKCPNEKGTADNSGCPEEIKKEIIEKVNFAAEKLQFTSSKAVLLPPSLKVLDDVVKILNENPSINVLIEGHTSAEGSLSYNMKLSEDRANTVKNYLLSKGIAEPRLTAKGFGPTQPLNAGKTFAERIQNRRVELKLSN
jgi:OmpA-OmpF porin, OOP family